MLKIFWKPIFFKCVPNIYKKNYSLYRKTYLSINMMNDKIQGYPNNIAVLYSNQENIQILAKNLI